MGNPASNVLPEQFDPTRLGGNLDEHSATPEKMSAELSDNSACSLPTTPHDATQVWAPPACHSHDHKRERQVRSLTSRHAFQAVRQHLRMCTEDSNALDPFLASQQAIAGFYCIFSALPHDLKAMVVARMEPPDVVTVQETSAPSVCRQCPLWQETVVNHVTDTQGSICDLLDTWDVSIRKATVRGQFTTEASVLPCRVVPWRESHFMEALNTDTRQYLMGLWRLQTIAKLARRSIQAAFPSLAQGTLIQEALIYTAQWAIPRPGSANPTKEEWLYFAHLTTSQRLSINNLLSNIAGVTLESAPFHYPKICSDSYCYLRWEAAERRGHRSAYCPCCNTPKCIWTLPRRLEEELDALGVTELLARMWIVRRTRSLLVAASQHALEARCTTDPCSLQDWWFDGEVPGCFTWTDVLGSARLACHSPHADIVISIPALKVIVVITGRRGNGHIRLQIAPQFRQQCHEHMFMMMDAIDLGHGEALDVDAWEQETEQGLGLLFECSRWCYWDVAEKGRWSVGVDAEDALGLVICFG